MPNLIPTLIAGTAIILLAHTAKGLTGFGAALVGMPILLLFVEPQVAVPIFKILSIITSFALLRSLYRHVQLKRIWLLILFGVIANPLGTWLLVVIDGAVLKAVIGPIVTLFALAFLLGFSYPIRNEKLGFALTGILSGFLGGCISIGGPPVVLFLSNQGDDKQSFRANLTVYFLITSIAGLASCGVGGLLTGDTLKLAVAYVPAALIGLWLGNKFVPRVKEGFFRRLVLVMVAFTGTIATLSGLRVI